MLLDFAQYQIVTLPENLENIALFEAQIFQKE
jgi:hypothetical protein